MDERVRLLSQQLIQNCKANRLSFKLEHSVSDIDVLRCFAQYVNGSVDVLLTKYYFLRQSFDLLMRSCNKDVLLLFCCRNEDKIIGLMRSDSLSVELHSNFPYFNWEDCVPATVVNRYCMNDDVIIWCYYSS